MSLTPDDKAQIAEIVAKAKDSEKSEKGMFSMEQLPTLLIALAAWLAVQMFEDMRNDPNELKLTINEIASELAKTKAAIDVIKSQLTNAEKLADAAGRDRYTRSMAERDKEVADMRFKRIESRIDAIQER
mgnify:CR=1 FL=1